MPDDLKKIIDDNSGPDASADFADAFDSTKAEDRKLVMEAGGDVYILPDEEYKRWQEATAGIAAEWVQEANAKGFDGEAILRKARATLDKYQK